MSIRLLIINGPSPYFLYIPMGTFGLCDYLEQQEEPEIQTRIINPSLYPEATIEETVVAHIDSFSPSHVAILFHWQETVHGMIQVIKSVANKDQSIPIMVGGITASYFARDLLLTYPGIDYVIKGDPELPLLQLFSGTKLNTIPNLIWRDDNNQIQENSATWQIDSTLLDTISFANCTYLHDAELYLNKIESILGFPLFIGRGCVFNCEYCGGSRHAFRAHSSRELPTIRSIDSIIKDLYLLKEQTDTLYICYENDRKYILSLFERISSDENLKGHFTLNYGAWHLIDSPFLALYKKAFQLNRKKPIFEFSPEVISDTSRKKIKGSASYPLEKLIDNCSLIHEQLQGFVRQEMFFSRYHPTETTPKTLLHEIKEIFTLKHFFFMQKNHSVNVCYDHLSTDIGGIYWQKYLPNNYNYKTFLKQKQQIDKNQLHPFPVDNLCFYIPEELGDKECLSIELLVYALNSIHKNCHELFHILFDCLGNKWIEEFYIHTKGKADKLELTLTEEHNAEPLIKLLDEFLEILSGADTAPPFLEDLTFFTLKKFRAKKSKTSPDLSATDDQPYTLNKNRISINQFNYLELHSFITSMQQQQYKITGYQRTVFLFLQDEILSLPHRSFREFFKPFENQETIEVYLKRKESPGGREAQKLNRKMLEKLIAHEVLIPVHTNS